MCSRIASLPLAVLVACSVQSQDPVEPITLPEIVLEKDDTRIDRSCRIVIPDGVVIEDENADGVIHVVSDGIRVEFAAGSVLRGAPNERSWDQLTGIGIRLQSVSAVELAGMDIRGFRIGIAADDANGLLIEDSLFLDNFRQRLHSTPETADDGRDWLDPHHNDAGEWAIRYGAGISIARSQGVVIRRCLVRRGQNGILLDRVLDSEVYDNDCSFLSGWGIALWRSSSNAILRNALDFCIRGYSHGVYNRGQDSAGLLMFEQCKDNIVAFNSITHGGDGVFAFAGREALGQKPPPAEGFEYSRAGNSQNLFHANDCSYAAAHGLEITFSYGNRIIGNRFAGNAICGIWGGYSSGMAILENRFMANGDAGYGSERGGINIEHGSENLIQGNQFADDLCGVFLWWDEDRALLATPWAQVNGARSENNRVVENSFLRTATALQLRRVQGTVFADNRLVDCGQDLDLDEDSRISSSVEETESPPPFVLTDLPGLGSTEPVGARPELAGRENIIMSDWGPWDHQEPMLRTLRKRGSEHVYELYLGEAMLRYTEPSGPVKLQRRHAVDLPGKPVRLRVSSADSPVLSYDIPV
ncbi:MAG: right-handed parallel beta-helix repeat-containing protein, partial [Planctomycetota bacterium]